MIIPHYSYDLVYANKMRKWLDAFRTVDWKEIKRNLELSGIVTMFETKKTLALQC